MDFYRSCFHLRAPFTSQPKTCSLAKRWKRAFLERDCSLNIRKRDATGYFQADLGTMASRVCANKNPTIWTGHRVCLCQQTSCFNQTSRHPQLSLFHQNRYFKPKEDFVLTPNQICFVSTPNQLVTT